MQSCLRTAIGLIALYGGRLCAQGYPPDEAARQMVVPEGMEVQLFAAEPMVRQPVAIEFDDRGRLWVIQYLQYPNPAGLKRVQVDRYSRTQYDQLPPPPPQGPEGADRITILEDKDGDGRAETSKDFVAGLNLATGITFGHGGVYVLNVPYLLFYPDCDGDDRPDSDPRVLLSGFGMQDAHSVANSLTWGPDGWLYGCQGSTVSSDIRGIQFEQGVWRYHPEMDAFELFAEGGGNSWGLDFDAQGNLLYSTNHGGYCMLHAMQGAYYWKNFGKHGALHNPHAYGYFGHVPHEGFKGGHVTVGGVVYPSTALPGLAGKYVAADLLGHAVYWHDVTALGSTFASRHGGELLLAGDTWFAPSDVTIAADGAIWVADWHDQRMAHPDPDAQWDRSNGRIYRLGPAGVRPPPAPDLRSLTTSRLLELLGSDNEWYARRARRLLSEQRHPAAREALQAYVTSLDAIEALRGLWALHGCGWLDDHHAGIGLASPHEHVRAWTVRLLGDRRRVPEALARKLASLAATDESVRVRAQLAATAKRLPSQQALPIIEPMLARDLDRDDPYVPLLLWWAVEHHALRAQGTLVDWFDGPRFWQPGLARNWIVERLMRRYAAEGSNESLSACRRLLLQARWSGDYRAMLVALDQGLVDAGLSEVIEAAPPQGGLPLEAVRRLLAELERTNASDPLSLRVSARLGSAAARQRALLVAMDSGLAVERRLEMLAVLAEVGRNDCQDELLKLWSCESDARLRSGALRVLARFDSDSIAEAALSQYPSLVGNLRQEVREMLLRRPGWCLQLLRAIDRGEFDACEIPLEEVRAIALHHDDQLDLLVRKHWGNVRDSTPEEKLAEIRRLNNDLRAGSGDAAAGKALFQKHCGSCHALFGEGGRLGPELTGGNRKDRDYLLASIVDPSLVVRKEYLSYVVETSDGRLLTGLITEQTGGSITLVNARDERTVVPRGLVERTEESRLSLMPENILGDLDPQQLRDLFAFLESDP